MKNRILKARIRKAERSLAALFRRQGRVTVAALARNVLREAEGDSVDRAFDDAVLTTYPDFTDWLQEHAGATFTDAMNATGVLLDAFEIPFPEAERYASRRAAELVRGVNNHTRDQLRALVTEAVEKGWSYDHLARKIRARFEGFAAGQPQKHIQSRAHLVAVTEMGQAYEEGSATIARTVRDAGVALEKAWLTAGDDRIEGLCLNNESAGWIPFDDPFPSGHMHPLAHPACRCSGLQRRKES